MSNLVYRRHTVADLFCTDCNEFLHGDGSMVLPYTCRCGQWEYNSQKHDWQLMEQKP